MKTDFLPACFITYDDKTKRTIYKERIGGEVFTINVDGTTGKRFARFNPELKELSEETKNYYIKDAEKKLCISSEEEIVWTNDGDILEGIVCNKED